MNHGAPRHERITTFRVPHAAPILDSWNHTVGGTPARSDQVGDSGAQGLEGGVEGERCPEKKGPSARNLADQPEMKDDPFHAAGYVGPLKSPPFGVIPAPGLLKSRVVVRSRPVQTPFRAQ